MTQEPKKPREGKQGFTHTGIGSLKPLSYAYRKFEKTTGASGFYVKVLPSGNKYFYILYRFDGKERHFKLGTYRGKESSLKSARKAYEAAFALLDSGIDPQADRTAKEKAKIRAEAERRQAEDLASRLGSVKTLFENYITHLRADGKRSANQVDRIWQADIKPVIGKLKARDVQPDDVKRVLHPIIQRGAMVLANRCRSYLMAAFRFGIEWDHDPKNYDRSTLFEITSNPARDVPKPQRKEAPAERALTTDELRECWQQWCDPALISLPVGFALRLIIATGGQRVEEVLRASWSEFRESEGLWEIPGSRTKSGRSHVVPLTQTAISVLDELRALSGQGELLFPLRKRKGTADTNPSEPMQTNSLGNAVRRFCKRAQKARTAELREQGKLPANGEAEYQSFTARDLRRTVKTLMGKLGVSKEFRDRLQNHALTDVSSKHYDRYDYLREKRNGMQAWEIELRRIIASTEAQTNVRALRAT